MKLFFVFLNLLFLLPLFSCQYATPSSENLPVEEKINIKTETMQAVDDLLKDCTNGLSMARPIIVASLVSVDDVHKSSTFGRMSAEIIASRLSQHGYNVKEMKMNQNQIYIKTREGEFVLSRNMQDIASKHNVQAVVVGTYAVSKAGYQNVFVCLKIVDPVSNIIGCSTCYISESHPKNWQ